MNNLPHGESCGESVGDDRTEWNEGEETAPPKEEITPEAQRIAIAEACGWHGMDGERSLDGAYLKNPEGAIVEFFELPDYLADLNAMHEAEKILEGKQLTVYIGELQRLLCRDDKDSNWIPIQKPATYIFHATPAQRAEAFLRTLNLWK